jgi:hypothetical protein
VVVAVGEEDDADGDAEHEQREVRGVAGTHPIASGNASRESRAGKPRNGEG